MEMFDVFSMNGIENYPAAGANFILKVSQTHFSKDFYPKGGGGINFSRREIPPQGGAVKYPGGSQGELWGTLHGVFSKSIQAFPKITKILPYALTMYFYYLHFTDVIL